MEQGCFIWKKKANKTKTLIEYSSILLLYSSFNKEKNKPNQSHISGYEQQYNRHIIYEKWEIIISFTSLRSSYTYCSNRRIYVTPPLNTALFFLSNFKSKRFIQHEHIHKRWSYMGNNTEKLFHYHLIIYRSNIYYPWSNIHYLLH